MIAALSLVAFQLTEKPGSPLIAQLTGDPVIPDIPGGWTGIARPKRRDMTDWKGQALKQMTLPLMLDGWAKQQSVEGDITRFYTLIEGNGTTPAPVISVAGPIPLTHLKWGVNGITWGNYAIRPGDGAKVRQMLTVTLLEYVSPDVTIATAKTSSPAQQAAAKATSGSAHTYTVRQNDTLTSIAASQLHDYSRWTEIASLNGLRDPKSIRVGQTLRLP